MRRAGCAVFKKIRRCWPDKNKLIVFCGAGNNAGDGYVIAKLALDMDIKVNVVSLVDVQKLKGDAFIAYQDYVTAGGLVSSFQTHLNLESAVLVDALLGTGLDRAVSGNFAEAIEQINGSNSPVIAVDIPSGLNADTGQVMSYAVRSDETVTFIALKQGLFTADAAEYCGNISFSSLQLPKDIYNRVAYSARLIQTYQLPVRQRCAHKGHFGHVLLIGGNAGYTGAIRMAAESALRSGAGLVSVARRAQHSHMINLGRPELMCHAVENREQLTALLAKASVVVIGPGLGQDNWAQSMLSCVLGTAIASVVDADALNLLARHPVKKNNWVLTPHPGEAARLLHCSNDHIQKDRFAAIKQLQEIYGGICLLKGAGTLILGDQDIAISTNGNPGMASGGMGDVLSGIIGGLAAQGIELELAVQTAVHVHGRAADICAAQDGERGLLASDLMLIIRKLLNENTTKQH